MTITVKQALVYGDSKGNLNWPVYWQLQAANSGIDLWYWQRLAVGGRTVALAQAACDAELAAITQPIHAVMFNLGANDVGAMPVQATWQSNLGYILDAMHVKWPTIPISIAKAWRQGFATECNTLVTWATTVIASRSWCTFGLNEIIYLENGDNGVGFTSDGIHYNTPGDIAMGRLWAGFIR